ncbi:Predicted membrane protein [Raoultella ornithinolytica]|nr:Predicted membrane protein [Raoultella ornithinolytica]
MTLQQWMFSIKGRIGRRDFWIWMAIWVLAMSVLFTLAGTNLLQCADRCVYPGVPAVADGGGDDQTPARSR